MAWLEQRGRVGAEGGEEDDARAAAGESKREEEGSQEMLS
jgi:hypothetical protein